MSNSRSKTLMLAYMGILTAIVIVLQLAASTVHLFGMFSITLVLAPIVVGSALYGWKAGTWLGFIFGVTVLLSGDAAPFMTVNIPGTIITVLLKGMLSGMCAGLVCGASAEKSRPAAVLTAGVVSPLVNTGIFLLGCRVFFMNTVRSWGFENIWLYMAGGIGLNFIAELLVNLALSTAIVQIINYVKRQPKKSE